MAHAFGVAWYRWAGVTARPQQSSSKLADVGFLLMWRGEKTAKARRMQFMGSTISCLLSSSPSSVDKILWDVWLNLVELSPSNWEYNVKVFLFALQILGRFNRARAARLTLPHFTCQTPLFMPVGTQGLFPFFFICKFVLPFLLVLYALCIFVLWDLK